MRRSEKWRAYPEDVLPLWVAEMDTPLAPPIRAALHDAVELGDTGYVHPAALPQAFAEFCLGRFGWVVEPERCAVVPDVMIGIQAVLRAVTAPGSGVLINPPVYPPYYSFVTQLDRRVVESPLVLEPDGRWRLDLDRLEADFARTDVSAYLLCNPHNPTGLVLARDELCAIAELAERHNVVVLADEIHGPLVYPQGAVFVPFLSLADEVGGAARAYAFGSASKAWNLPGLKAAVAVAGPEADPDLGVLPEELLFGAGLLGVLASEVALREGVPWLDALLVGLDANRILLGRMLAEALPEVGYVPPDSTFLAWLDCRALHLGDDPAAVFLRHGRVALNAGPTFGAAGRGFVRLNFATSPQILAEAVERMAAATIAYRSSGVPR
jgi:cystathionine beta-lyase